MTIKMEDITAGESWGCRFRVRTLIDPKGKPVNTTHVPPGTRIDAEPGFWESIGSIEIRDVDNRLVQVVDHELGRTWHVSWDDCWDIDRVEYKEAAQDLDEL